MLWIICDPPRFDLTRDKRPGTSVLPMPEPRYSDRNYRTLKDVALAVGVSRQRVSQVVKQHRCSGLRSDSGT